VNGAEWLRLDLPQEASVRVVNGKPVRVSIIQAEGEASIPDIEIERAIKALTGRRCRIVGGLAAWDRGERAGEAVAKLETIR
jgi:hypothetical protein